ncbi:MAG: penicillin-binding transpeptidase domain-containing protein [Bacillota bacterium]|jgi:stage V sporulation protein D (sporulation-specific penicillin-binding protein)|nr:penicillin-binding transpeptidase domain-containing protein [Bacillota bacterium]
MNERPNNKKNPSRRDNQKRNRGRRRRVKRNQSQVLNSGRPDQRLQSRNTGIVNNGDNTSSRKYNRKQSKKSDFLKRNQNIHKDVSTTYKNSKNSSNAGSKRNSNKNRYKIRINRKAILFVSTLILFVLIYYVTVLYDVQVNKHDEMSQMANDQYYRKIKTPPKRGDILDRNGRILATTTNIYRIGITPKHVYSLINTQSETEIGETLAGVLGIAPQDVKRELAKKDETYIQLAKDVSQDKAELLEEYLLINQIGGVRLDPEPQRVFFNDNVASQIIGFSSLNGDVLEGRLGVEYELNSILSGQAGFSFGARDNYSKSGLLPFSESTEQTTRDGYNVTLTLDYEISKQLQEYLERAIVSLEAKKQGMGLIMDVENAEILGIASYPYFSSADPTAKPTGIEYEAEWEPTEQETIDFLMENVWRNKAISDLFEVGSTFKIVTAAMGMEENITHEEKLYSDDPIDVLDYTISCYTGDGHGTETLADAFTRSCNPPFVQISLDLGVEKYYDYVDAFGFTEASGVQLPGEAKNMFHENPSLIDMATLAFGEQSQFNLVSYSKGLSSIVNGGNLITPTIVKQITDQQNRIVQTFEPQVERRVISENTSKRVNKLLQRNDIMQGINKVSPGYSLGGKTSTSTDEVTDSLTMSYVSFAPIDNPKIMTILVVQDIGRSEAYSDNMVSPVSGLTNWVLDYLSIERNYTENQLQTMQETVAMPDIYGQTLEEATYNLNYQSIIIKPGVPDMKSDDPILAFAPKAGTALHHGSTVYAYPDIEIAEDLVIVPDFTGKSFNECILTAEKAGVIVQFEGDVTALAVSQTIADPDGIVIIDEDIENEQTETSEQALAEDQEIEDEQPEDNMRDEDQKVQYVQRGSIIKVVLGSGSTSSE